MTTKSEREWDEVERLADLLEGDELRAYQIQFAEWNEGACFDFIREQLIKKVRGDAMEAEVDRAA